MAEPSSIAILGSVKAAVSPLLGVFFRAIIAVLKFTKSKVEKDLAGYTALKKFGLAESKDDFDSLYVVALYNLIYEQKKSSDIVKLFELSEVKKSFYDEVYLKNNWSFAVALDSNLHTNPTLRNLKKYSVDLVKEIDDFKDEFEKVVNQSRLPKDVEQRSDILRGFAKIQRSIDDKFGKVEIASQLGYSLIEPAQLANHSSRREQTVAELLQKIEASRWVSIHGSISTGKTQLSLLVYNAYAHDKLIVPLRGYEDNYVAIVLAGIGKLGASDFKTTGNVKHDLVSLISKLKRDTLIVLDDLPHIDGTNSSDEFFVLLLKTASENGIRVLSTTNFLISSKIKHLMPEGHLEEIKVPFLTENEVAEIILTFVNDSDAAGDFKDIVHQATSGHPTITAAACRYLNANGWKLSADEVVKLFGGDFDPELTENTRRYLSKTVEDESTRELLYRLNLVVGHISEEDIRLVAGIEPAIRDPFNRVTGLLGLWVQRHGEKHYELSPLIKGLGKINLDESTNNRIYVSLGESILNKSIINPIEAGWAISYFISGKNFNKAGFILTHILQYSVNNPQSYFRGRLKLFWISTELPNQMDLTLRIQIRFLQTSLYNAEGKDLTFLLQDFEKLIAEAPAKGIDVAIPCMWIAVLFSKSNANKASEYFIRGYKTFDQMVAGLPPDSNVQNPFYHVTELIWTTGFSISTKSEFDGWLAAFKELSPKQKEAAMRSDGAQIICQVIFMNLIRREEHKPAEDRDWQTVLNDFEYIKSHGDQLSFTLLSVNAVRFMILVLCDDLKQMDQANDMADKYLQQYSGDQNFAFLINDMIGRQLYYNGRNAKAEKYLAEAVSLEVSEFYADVLETYYAFSRLTAKKDQVVAHVYSVKAYEYAKKNKFVDPLKLVKVIGEYSISLFLVRKLVDAIYAMEEGFAILIDSYERTIEYRLATIRYGHCLNYFRQMLVNGKPPDTDLSGEPYTAPERGLFGAKYTDASVEQYDLPERRYMNAYLMMATFEHIGDFEIAKKWAYKCLELDTKLKVNYFTSLIHQCIAYLISDKKFDDAIRLQLETVNKQRNFDPADFDYVSGFPKMAKERPMAKALDHDDILIEHAVMLMVVKCLNEILENEESRQTTLDQCISVLQRWEPVFNTKQAIQEIVVLLTMVNAPGETDLNAIMVRVNSYSGQLDPAIKTIGYLLLSMNSTSVQAAQQHYAFIARLDGVAKKFGGGYPFIVVPFFEKFWLKRFDNDGNSFFDYSTLRLTGLPKYRRSQISGKLRTLFKILTYHLPPANENTILSAWVDSPDN